MYEVFVIVKVKPGQGDVFLETAKKNRDATRLEPGNVRFDVLKAPKPSSDPEYPELFYLFEVYRSAEDFAAHQKSAHYFAFREESADMMAEPRQGIHAIEVYADPWE